MLRKILTLALILLVILASAQKKGEITNKNGIERPKVVIGLVVDQMRWDYLYRYYKNYSENGFKRLLNKGFSFENAFIPYTPPVTAAGHACIYTGSVGAINGMVGNSWIDRMTSSYVYCTQDLSVSGVGSDGPQGKMSPENLLTTTIGDELRLASNFKSRVYGVSLKDRGGILAAGRSGNAAYWFDDATGNWISSTWYMSQLPSWVNQFNTAKKADSMMMKDWVLSENKSFYDQSTADDMPFERTMQYNKQRTFPHSYKEMIGKNYYDFRVSPYGNTFTLDFATRLINEERLGITGQTDMLCISLSSTDYIGHTFGPNSLEVQDTYLRLDRDIAKFLTFLDSKLGSNNYLLFLSSDHGAPQVPDFLKEKKIGAGHLNAYYGIRDSLNKIGLERFGTGNLVRSVLEYQVFLYNRVIDSLKLNATDIKNYFVKYLNAQPAVSIAFDFANFQNVIIPEKLREMLSMGYYYNRSGDIQFILKPGYTDVGSTGTEHGTIYNYDTHIPLIWYGWKVKPGKTHREVHMTDIAPTISAMLKIEMPNGSVGKVLKEVVE